MAASQATTLAATTQDHRQRLNVIDFFRKNNAFHGIIFDQNINFIQCSSKPCLLCSVSCCYFSLSSVWNTHDENPHEWVQAQFAAELIHRRKVFPATLPSILRQIQSVRNIADYKPSPVGKTDVERQVRKSTTFVNTVQGKIS